MLLQLYIIILVVLRKFEVDILFANNSNWRKTKRYLRTWPYRA